jgi:hypothetical protein
MAGYSGKPLAQKLGISDASRIAVVNLPTPVGDEAAVLALGDNTIRPELDLILFFTKSAEELSRRFPELIRNTVENGSIWISWPKKSSRLAADLDGNIVRDIGLEAGVVDVKVCAIDENWSGLKFVRRLKDRR